MSEQLRKMTTLKPFNPHAGHRQRMKERFRKTGFDSFAEHEIMEFLLFQVMRQGNTNGTGHALIKKFGSVDNVLRAEFEELIQVNGVGPSVANYIVFLRELYLAYQKHHFKSNTSHKLKSRASDSGIKTKLDLRCESDEHFASMRERFDKTGFSSFTEYEIMTFLLSKGLRIRNIEEVSTTLIDRFGSLKNVMRASFEELVQVKGVGASAAEYVLFLRELYLAYQKYHFKDVSLEEIEERCSYFLYKLSMESDEKLMVACLDDNMHVQCLFVAAKGTPGSVHVSFQSLLRNILNSHCSTVILAHNHPKGNAAPSYEDIELTKRIAELLRQVEIHLEDHIIVGNGRAISMSRTGTLMPLI